MKAYAYKCNQDGIIAKTLTDTERGAKVNALWIIADHMCMADNSDSHINNQFRYRLGKLGTIVQVYITEVEM